jgi:hypothetical protein
MAIRLKELLKLPSMRKIRILAGESGLDHIVTWPYVCQMNSFSEWVQGGEIIFVTGIGIKSDEESLISLILDGNNKDSAGIVFFTGKYISSIPEKVLELSNQLDFPIFEIPWEVKLVDITKEISGYILNRQNKFNSARDWAESILFGGSDSSQDISVISEYLGFDLNIPRQVAIIVAKSRDLSNVLNEAEKEEHPNYFFTLTQDFFYQYEKESICLPHNNSLVIILPVKNGIPDNNIKLLDKVCGMLLNSFKDLSVYSGIGRAFKSVNDLKKSYIDAERILKLAISAQGTKNILSYRDLGLFRLFFEISDKNELHEFYTDILGPLLEYDKQNNTELVKTLEVYFENKLNHSKTSLALYIHRNSLVYRLNRIGEILGRRLDDPVTLLELQTCILIGKFLTI